MFRAKTERDKGFAAGVEAAADYIAQLNSSTTHGYRLDDCVLCKFDATKRRRPRPNKERIK